MIRPTEPIPIKCAVCIHGPIPGSVYCLRCHDVVTSTCHDRLPRRLAAQNSYNQALDAFLCALTGVVLNLDNPSDPCYRAFSEVIPGHHQQLIMVSSLGAMLKSDLTQTELLAVVPELHDHYTLGRPFTRNIIPFGAWNRSPFPLPVPVPPFAKPLRATGFKCEVCIRPRKPGTT